MIRILNVKKHKRDLLIVVLIGAPLLLITLREFQFGKPVAVLFAIWFAMSVLSFLLLLLYRRLNALMPRIALKDYRQIESLLSLISLIELNAPLPPMRRFSASPDFLLLIASKILKDKPRIVVEVGSGATSVVVSYFLKKIGRGKLVTLDHSEIYANLSRAGLAEHHLTDIAKVIYAPLRDFEINGKKWQWYDLEKLENINTIDMLIVDGPPGGLQQMARYPAIPLLADRLQKGATIFIDDADRQDERQIVKRWVQEFSGISETYHETETGAYVIKVGGPLKQAPVHRH